MNILDEIAALRRRGIDILRAACDVAPRDLVDRTGISLTEARTWTRTARDYLGPTRYTAVRRRVVAAAEANGHSLQTLAMINTHARRLATDAERWALRETLTAMTGDYDAILEAAKDATRIDPETDTSPPTLGHSVDHKRQRINFTLSVRMNQGRDLLNTLYSLAGSPTGHGLSAEDKGRALMELLGNDDAIAPTTVTPLVVLGADQYSAILAGEGDDIVLALSDGTTMTGAEFINARMSEHGYVGLFHPVKGPTNLYRTERFFNHKQRVLAQAESPVCVWPDCNHPAQACQAHHLEEWEDGGQTNMCDCAMLCAYHNAINGLPGRGRMIRDEDGWLKWLPPGGGPPRIKDHPVSTKGAMHLI